MNDGMAVVRYVTNYGPLDGPIRARDHSHTIQVFREGDSQAGVVGIALPYDFVMTHGGLAKVYHLTVKGVDPNARFIRVGRLFVEPSGVSE